MSAQSYLSKKSARREAAWTRRAKRAAAFDAMPPGLTVAQIKKLAHPATDKALLDGEAPHVSADGQAWCNGYVLLMEPPPAGGYNPADVKTMTDDQISHITSGHVCPTWPVELQLREAAKCDFPAIVYFKTADGRSVPADGQLVGAVLARAEKGTEAEITYWLKDDNLLPSVLVRNGHNLGVLMTVRLNRELDAPIATIRYSGDLPGRPTS